MRLPVKAVVDPFFAAYGLQIEVDHQAILPHLDWGLRRKIERLPKGIGQALNSRLDLLRQSVLLTSLQIKIPYGHCTQCSFLAPWFEVGDDQLRDYYSFYLQPEYRQARTLYQPGFRQLGAVMGSAEEAELRRQQHEQFIAPYLQQFRLNDQPLRILDYGGGRGLLIPKFDWVVGAVADVVSSSLPESATETYDAVQCMHVLEHVGNPSNTLSSIIGHCRPGGLIYVEVPCEYPGAQAVNDGALPPCHEHINKLSLNSVRGLFDRPDLEVLLIEAGEVDFLHLDGMTPVIRALARKTPC